MHDDEPPRIVRRCQHRRLRVSPPPPIGPARPTSTGARAVGDGDALTTGRPGHGSVNTHATSRCCPLAGRRRRRRPLARDKRLMQRCAQNLAKLHRVHCVVGRRDASGFKRSADISSLAGRARTEPDNVITITKHIVRVMK